MSSVLSLPPELLELVLGPLLVDGNRPVKLIRSSRHCFRLELLAVCRDFREIGKKLFYGQNKFLFAHQNTLQTIVRSPGVPFCDRIQHLVLPQMYNLGSKYQHLVWPNSHGNYTDFALLATLTALKSIKLQYEVSIGAYSMYYEHGLPKFPKPSVDQGFKRAIERALEREWKKQRLALPFPEVEVTFPDPWKK